MKRFYILVILMLPLVLWAQVEWNNGAVIIDWNKKKEKPKPKQDSVQGQTPPATSPGSGGNTTPAETPPQADYGYEDDEEDENGTKKQKPSKDKKVKPANTTSASAAQSKQETQEELKKSFFKGILHLGLNAAQIDGDSYAGYNYPGVAAGIGAMVKFHKLLSVSLEMNYSMKGARQAFFFRAAPQTLQRYMTQADYIEIPVTFNIQDPKYVMFSLGLAPGYMIRYKQRNEMGDDVTNVPFFELKKFDLMGMAAFHVFIKRQFGFGLKFAYSLIKLGGPVSTTGISRANGRYNNVLTLRFMYILDPSKLKKKSN